MDQSLTIKPGAATDDVKQIQSIVSSIEECLATLDNVINKNIPENLETEWSIELGDSWKEAYNDSIQEIMHEMTLSATNLQMAVNAAVAYSSYKA